MGDLRDYSAFADPPLRLPINGKVYEVPPVGIEAGLQMSGILTGTNTEYNGKPGEELWQLALGKAWDAMVADGVTYAAASRAGFVALVDVEYGRAAAEAAWDSGSNPEAEAAHAAADRGPETQSTTQPAEADTTPTPASGPGMSLSPEPTMAPEPEPVTPG